MSACVACGAVKGGGEGKQGKRERETETETEKEKETGQTAAAEAPVPLCQLPPLAGSPVAPVGQSGRDKVLPDATSVSRQPVEVSRVVGELLGMGIGFLRRSRQCGAHWEQERATRSRGELRVPRIAECNPRGLYSVVIR